MPDPHEPLTITVLRTDDISPDVRADIIDVCNAANDTDAFHELFTLIPTNGRHILVHHDGVLVSHAVATTRGVQPAEYRVLHTAYLDAVATRPEHQGRGYGSVAHRHMAAEVTDYEIGCLQTDVAPFYERLGWKLWHGPLAGRSPDGLLPTPDQTGVMILPLPLTPPLDRTALLTIECQPNRIWE